MSTRSVARTRYERDIWRAVLNISLGMNTTVLLGDLCFTEAPRWRGNRLYFSDFYRHKVLAKRKDFALGCQSLSE